MSQTDKRKLREQYNARKITGGVFVIKNSKTGKMLLQWAADLQGSRNRFEFSKKTGSCVNLILQREWNIYGADAFDFEILNQLDMKDEQTQNEFTEEIKLLETMWRERLEGRLY